MPKKTLSEKLAELTNPTPNFIDPEDEYNEETKARLDHYDDDYDNDVNVGPKTAKNKTNLRQRNAGILADSDQRYAGKRVSRKDLQYDSDEDESREEDGSEEDDSDFVKNDGNDVASEDEDGHIQEFLSMMKAKSGSKTRDQSQKKKTSYDMEDSNSEEGEEEGDDFDSEGEEEEDDGDEDGENEEDGEEENGEDVEMEEDEEIEEDEEMEASSKRSFSSEADKGKAIQSQLSLWDHLLECRIKFHKGIHLANQLPQGSTDFKFFVKAADSKFNSAVKETQTAVKTLMDSFLELQKLVLKSNPQTKSLLKANSEDTKEDSDEEIPSDTEEEAESEEEKDDEGPPKKKMKITEYGTEIQTLHDRYRTFCNKTLHFWNEKTRLASGRAGKGTGKSGGFGAFEQSILKQIEIILADKQRLINRTRIKRSAYRILGTEPKSALVNEDPAPAPDQPIVDGAATPQAKDTEEDQFDAEIYDDDDFYHQLLRELIERRTGEGGSDQVSLGRQWLEIQKLRSKAKRHVDPKASKGRRLRYQVHPKLVSLMAPYPETSWNDAAKNELFASLFANA